MVLSFKTGQWSGRATVGNDVITGVGFQPKVVLIWTGNYDGTNDSIASYFQFGFGAAVDTTAANQRSIFLYSADAAAISSTAANWDENSVTIPGSASSQGYISAIGSDGFTVNWTVVDGVPNKMFYVCIGGADVTNTKCGHITSPTAGSTGNQVTSGIGFQPDVVLWFGCGNTAVAERAGMAWGFGMATSSSNQVCSSGVSKNGSANMDCKRYQRSDNTNCFALIDETTTTNKALEGALVSMNADGFTINWTTVASGGASRRIGYIAIKGGNYKVGSTTSPTTGTVPVSKSTSGVGFQPRGLITVSGCSTSSTSIQANNHLSLGGGSSSVDRRCSFNGDNDTVAAAVTMSINNTTKIITMYTVVATETNSTVNAAADVASMNADGFTLSWTTRDANAYEVLYLAVGDTAVVTGAKNLQIAKGYFYSDN